MNPQPLIVGIGGTTRVGSTSERALRMTLAAAQALGKPSLHQLYYESDSTPEMAEASTEALILSPTAEGLRDFSADQRWNSPARTVVRPWTDDYVNLFGSLQRSMFDTPELQALRSQ